MRRIRRRVTRSEPHTMLFFAAGAVAGAAAGVLLGRRFRTRRDFFDAVRDKIGVLKDYWDAAEIEENGHREHVLEGVRDLADDLSDDDADDELLDDEAETFAAEAPEGSSDDVNPEELDHAQTEHADERALEHRVLAAFEEDAVLKSRAIDIAAVGASVVELSGWVHSLEEAARAASVARRVPGVSMVLNRLAVRGEGGVDTEGVASPVDATRVPDVVRSEDRGETAAS